jgi:eukaryotic-like serine/threonine-protein kinase
MAPAVGDVLANRYEVEELIGRGGMGEVFRARDRSLSEIVALKSIVLEGSDIVPTLRRFREEVRLARRVTHRCVARVFDLVEDPDGRIFLTMELIEGVTLKTLLDHQSPLPAHIAARIAIDVCSGISAVHGAGVVHRDLKPTNILVEETRAVIADFGVAKNVRDPNSIGLGSVVGTLHYMAPEQAQGRPVDYRADIYALGAMLHEMFCGRVAAADRVKHLSEAAIDPELRAVLQACLSFEPASRPSPEEVSLVLKAMADRLPPEDEERRDPAKDQTRLKVLASEAAGGEGEATRSDVPRVERTLASSPMRSETSIVVLPFREVGSSSSSALGEVVAQELTDVLCATRGLRVLATSAATRFKDDRDPLRIGRELSVSAIVDGTLRVSGETIRMGIRLIDAGSGAQLWTETFSGSLGDMFSFESVVAKRVAERLRARVLLIAFDSAVPAEAVRCYLDARAASRTPAGLGETARLLERALELAPELSPALAAYAMNSMVCWFVPFSAVSTDEQTCLARVERALRGASSLAETHVASGLLAWEKGQVTEALSAFQHALRLAPTCIDALSLIGELYCRIGTPRVGSPHLRSAVDLDPTRFSALAMLAREEAFAGRPREAMALLDTIGDVFAPPAFLGRVRTASWYGDEKEIRSCLTRAHALVDSAGPLAYGHLVARTFLGEAREGEMQGLVEALLALGKSPRLAVEVLMISVETHTKVGELDLALSCLERLAAIPAFFDLDWLQRCPGIELLRGGPIYASTREVVRDRVRPLPS